METSWKRHERLEPASQIIWLPAEPRAVRPLVLHQRALAHGEQVLARWWSAAEASARRKQSWLTRRGSLQRMRFLRGGPTGAHAMRSDGKRHVIR